MGLFQTIASIVNGAVKPVTNMVDKLTTSDQERLELNNAFQKLVNDLITRLVAYFEEELKARKEIILAELKGSWLTQNWRPLLMLMIMFILLNNLVFVPYMNAAFGWSVLVGTGIESIPSQLWNLLTAGVGGYVGGRSIEKIVSTISNRKKNGG